MFTGQIAAVEHSDQSSLRLHVRNVTSPLAQGSAPHEIYVHVPANSEIVVRQPSGARGRGNVKDLLVGIPISVWHTGVEIRSLPPQYTATRVHVTHTLERPANP